LDGLLDQFALPVLSSDGNLRLYYPAFVILTGKNEYFIIEAKGRKDIDVEYKDKRIKLWCKDTTNLTKSSWSFKRVNQKDFEKYRFISVKELISTLKDDG
jgi:type III restriction enzyme